MMEVSVVILVALAMFLWALMCWTIGFKQGKQEGYTAGYMKGRNVGRSSVGTK